MLKVASSEETALELTIKETLARQIAEAQKALDDMLVGSYFAWMQQCRKRTHNPYHSRTCCYFNFTRGMTGTREGAPLSIQAVRQGDARVPCFRCTAGYMVLRIPFVKNGPAGGGVRRGRRRVRLRSARGRVCSAHRRTAACWAHDEPHARASDRVHPADCVPHAGARPREHAACGLPSATSPESNAFTTTTVATPDVAAALASHMSTAPFAAAAVTAAIAAAYAVTTFTAALTTADLATAARATTNTAWLPPDGP